MNLSAIITRLDAQCPSLKLVGGAAQFERAAGALTAIPAAFVLPASESATESPFGNQLVEQMVTAEFVVLIAARNLADGEGAAAVETLEPLRESVRGALLNWVPDDGYQGCEYRAGELLAFDNGTLWWQDRYASAYLIRSQ